MLHKGDDEVRNFGIAQPGFFTVADELSGDLLDERLAQLVGSEQVVIAAPLAFSEYRVGVRAQIERQVVRTPAVLPGELTRGRPTIIDCR